MTLSRSVLVSILDAEGIRPSKALGQNFVADPNTVRRIARLAAVGPGDSVVEIGAGLGSLTLALAETGATVVAVEKDRRLLPALRSVVEGASPHSTGPADSVHVAEGAAAPHSTGPADSVHVVEGDALSLEWVDEAAAACGAAGPWILVANLPYNIATPLVVTVLESVPQVIRMLVMVQKEVGERFVALPGDEAYGAVSVKIAYWAKARIAGHVPATVFVPRPKVDSVLVDLVRTEAPPVSSDTGVYAQVRAVIDAGFATRRKMLRNALADLCDSAAFGRAGIDASSRAEELGVAQWRKLAAEIRNRR